MKLEKELPLAIIRIEALKKRCDVIAYRENLRIHGEYKDFTTRFINDIKAAVLKSDEVCAWYEKYQCNDTHITSLMKEACKQTGIL